jgi:DNA-binding transcriptional regulator YhcF (GntR family)
VILEGRTDSPVAPYEQIRAQIAAHAATGDLPPGHRLPSIRQLANDLGLAAGTVARAYRELEADGVVVSGGARGTTVASPADTTASQQRARRLREAARAYVDAVSHLGVGSEQAVDAVARLLDRGGHDHRAELA